MPKVDNLLINTEGQHGFVVRHDNNRLAARFDFETRHDAIAAQMKTQEVLARCEQVTGYARPMTQRWAS